MRNVYAGIDIGTSHVKVVLAGPPESPDMPMKLLGSGSALSRGMRSGYVVEPKEVSRGVREAVLRASQAAGVSPVKSARVSIGGVGLEEVRATGETSLTASGGIVTDRDVDRALGESRKRASSKLANRTILHTIPIEYRVDGKRVEGRPGGMQGAKLAVDVLLITILTQHHDDLIEAVESAGVEVEGDLMASPLAASVVTLTKAQQMAGVVLADIGAETLSLLVFDNGVPTSLKVLPSGSSEITNAIALSFQVPLAEAEQLKRGAVTGTDIPARKMQTVVGTRLKSMFALVNAHLKSIGCQRLLPAGIVLTGGGSGWSGIIDIARQTLKLPVQVAVPLHGARIGSLDATWSVAYGLCRSSLIEDRASVAPSVGELIRKSGDALRGVFRSLLP